MDTDPMELKNHEQETERTKKPPGFFTLSAAIQPVDCYNVTFPWHKTSLPRLRKKLKSLQTKFN